MYLIDTHVLIWYIAGDPRLDTTALTTIKDKSNLVFVSKVSLWEIVIKASIGKLKLDIDLSEIEKYLERNRIAELDFGYAEFKELNKLPLHHRDPFDRMIIAQAITNKYTLITDDPKFHLYPVQLLRSE